jgi:putative aldouronate transport system permease protein
MVFQNYSPALGFFKSPWVGLENFRYLFSNTDFYRVMANTLSISVTKIALGIVVPIVYALLLNEMASAVVKRSVQTVVYLPYFISWVLLGGIIIDILSPAGIINVALGRFEIKPILFLADNRWFRPVVIITHIWKEFGWGTIIYLAALAGVDPMLYEAATIDGAGRIRQTISVTLPGIIPTIILMMALSLGSVLNAGFEQIFNLYSPVVYETGDIIDTFVYRLGLKELQFSFATAVGIFKSVIAFILIFTSNKLAYKFAGYTVF